MTAGIYIITERATGKMYVGFSKSGIEGRWESSAHRKRFPKDSHSYEILLVCPPETTESQLKKFERFYISELDCMEPYGFNRTRGGNGSGLQSAESRQKKSDALKGRKKGPMSEEQKKQLSEAGKKNPVSYWKGKSLSQETREKLSEAQKGKPGKRLGKKNSEEHRRKLSEAAKARKFKKLQGQLFPPVDENREVTSETSVESGPAPSVTECLV